MEQIMPGGNKATLTLDNGETFDLKSSCGTELKEKDGTVIQVDSAALHYAGGEGRLSGRLAYNKVSVPQGGEYRLTLSDGSKVYLNSLSSVRFPARFAKDVRMVELEGEAYFEEQDRAAVHGQDKGHDGRSAGNLIQHFRLRGRGLPDHTCQRLGKGTDGKR